MGEHVITQEEKIDYIYKTLRKQEHRRNWRVFLKILFWLGIMIYMLYFYFFGFDILLGKIKTSLTPDMHKIENFDSKALIDNVKSKININF